MPRSFKSIFVVAFNLDEHGQAIQAFLPRPVQDEAAEVEAAEGLGAKHVGVLVWKLEGDPVVGGEGEPAIVYQHGKIGDFN
jgi:hypothetical protein